MGFADQSTQQKFPFNFDRMFDGLVYIIPRIGFTLKSQDKVIGRITASAPMSALSWGENITINVEKIGDDSTLVVIDSGLKLGANYQGQHRHQKNFDKIIQGLSGYLQESTQKQSGESDGVVSSNNEVAGRHTESGGRPAEISGKGKKKKSHWVLILVGLLLASCVLCGVIGGIFSNKLEKNRIKKEAAVADSNAIKKAMVLELENKMNKALSVKVISKSVHSSYDSKVDITLSVRNTSNKTIDSFDGYLEFYDHSDTLLKRFLISEMGGIKEGLNIKPYHTLILKREVITNLPPIVTKDTEVDWKMMTFAVGPLNLLKVVWRPADILWKDGASIEIPLGSRDFDP